MAKNSRSSAHATSSNNHATKENLEGHGKNYGATNMSSTVISKTARLQTSYWEENSTSTTNRTTKIGRAAKTKQKATHKITAQQQQNGPGKGECPSLIGV